MSSYAWLKFGAIRRSSSRANVGRAEILVEVVTGIVVSTARGTFPGVAGNLAAPGFKERIEREDPFAQPAFAGLQFFLFHRWIEYEPRLTKE